MPLHHSSDSAAGSSSSASEQQRTQLNPNVKRQRETAHMQPEMCNRYTTVLYRYRTGSRHKLVTATPVKKHRGRSRSNTGTCRCTHHRSLSERASEPAAAHDTQPQARAQPNRYHVHSLVSNTGTCTIIGHSERPLRCSHAREPQAGAKHPLPSTYSCHTRQTYTSHHARPRARPLVRAHVHVPRAYGQQLGTMVLPRS